MQSSTSCGGVGADIRPFIQGRGKTVVNFAEDQATLRHHVTFISRQFAATRPAAVTHSSADARRELSDEMLHSGPEEAAARPRPEFMAALTGATDTPGTFVFTAQRLRLV